jgi:hypothetical protein
MFLLDGSCSMSTPFPLPPGEMTATQCSNSESSRWGALREALVGSGGLVFGLDGFVAFGLAVFGTAASCPIAIQGPLPAFRNAQSISAALPLGPPGQYTPAGEALAWVVDNAFVDSDPDTALQPRTIVLVTDGQPNTCADPTTNFQPSVDAVTLAATMDISTHVLSLATSAGAFRDHLQQLAAIGSGTFHEPSSPEELTAALQLVIASARNCLLRLNGRVTPGRECTGQVVLNGFPLACNDPDGWRLRDERTIELVGQACEAFASPSTQVTADFPCGVFTPD